MAKTNLTTNELNILIHVIEIYPDTDILIHDVDNSDGDSLIKRCRQLVFDGKLLTKDEDIKKFLESVNVDLRNYQGSLLDLYAHLLMGYILEVYTRSKAIIKYKSL